MTESADDRALAQGDEHGTMMTLLPPPAHCCQECAVEHDPRTAHNAQTLFYRVWFSMQHGRPPTWNDAIAHCSDEMRGMWIAALTECGVDMASTKLTP